MEQLLRAFLRAQCRYMNPIRSFDFFQNYFETIKKISLYRDIETRLQIRAIQLILTFSVMWASIVWRLPRTPQYEYLRLVLFDFYGMNNFPPFHTFLVGGISLGMIYFYQQFYFDFYSNPIRALLCQMLLKNRRWFVFGDRSVSIRKWMMNTLHAYQEAAIAINLFLLVAYVQMLATLVRHPTFGWNWNTLAALILQHIFGFIFLASVSFGVSIGGLVMSIVVGTTKLFEVRHRALTKLLAKARGKRATWALLRYAQENVITLRYLGYENRFYGPMLTIFMLTNLPISGLLFVTAFGNIGRIQAVVAIAVGINQLFVIEIIHLLATRFSSKVHTSYREVLSRYLKVKQMPLRCRTHLVWNIQAFLTKNKYGINYTFGGSLGLISLLAFSKVFFKFILLYLLGIFEKCFTKKNCNNYAPT